MDSAKTPVPANDLMLYINLKLAALGQPVNRATADSNFLELTRPLLRNHCQKDHMLHRLSPVDARIQAFLDDTLREICPKGAPRLPLDSFVLDRPGLARAMSLPPTSDFFGSTFLKSYRLPQGILHNPKSDRRTTQGLFHIVEGGLPVPADKAEVPKAAFAALLAQALHPPTDLLQLPFTADQDDAAHLFVSLLMRPLVCPASALDKAKTMEIRFFAPGSLVSNLDFVESIFGNAGDPYLPENDAALDALHWTGHTGCVILAPHLVALTKKDLGLPRFNEATEHQKRDGMCWKEPDELYNRGGAFKLACRDARGIMVTIIADNYFGYCKKEVKTQISFSANLFGLCEEEHAGGALAFPTYILGQDFFAETSEFVKKVRFDDALRLLGERAEPQPEGYAIDRTDPSVRYVPENAEFDAAAGFVRWKQKDVSHQIPLRAGDVYVLPSGYKVRLEKQLAGTAWRLVGARPDGTLCHKPCTVSGGGKSEISKSIAPYILKGPVFVKDFEQDLNRVAEIMGRDFSGIYREGKSDARRQRPILSAQRSIGSVVKLLTPSDGYTEEHNRWVRELPQTIRQLVFTVKRYYRAEWGDRWREKFAVDRINGFLGHELKHRNETLVANYLRVGFDPQGAWRVFKLRPDFNPADKVQMEDDITASVVLPKERLPHLDPECTNASVKIVANCEAQLFQRPDDAVIRGFDKQAEIDLATSGTFMSNFEPLTLDQAQALVDHVVEFDLFTEPMKRLLEDFVKGRETAYVVSSAHPRLVDGKPSKNPRYLQKRPDLANPRDTYVAEVGTRLSRAIPSDQPVLNPVNAVLAGRRNNPPEPKIDLPPLAVYNPIHYQELPELVMDFICSLTGKSPSTTGFGSEGALTKGPFNALWPVVDLNNLVVSMILTEYDGFTTAASHVGPHYRVDHDISMLVPEIWCRMRVAERSPRSLIENGFLEPLKDFEHQGRKVETSRLGYRITTRFVDHFLGRIFETPTMVFTEELLKPEKQDLDAYVAGVEAIVEAQTRVAKLYFEDGSVDAACPPLKALLHLMAHGTFEGKPRTDPAIRKLFSRASLVASDWYQERLRVKQQRDTALWRRHIAALEGYTTSNPVPAIDASARLAAARHELARVSAPAYLQELTGTIGADPFDKQLDALAPGSHRLNPASNPLTPA
jgi:phosphoenolpyruvate carboxykinase (diphosphate)